MSKTNAGTKLKETVNREAEPDRSRPSGIVPRLPFDPTSIEAFADELPSTASLMSNEFLS